MPREVIRTDPEEDLYVVCSSVVDDLVAVGTAREVLDFLSTPGTQSTDRRTAERMVGRAAAYGGSGLTVWDKDSLISAGAAGFCPARASASTPARWQPRSP